MRRISHVISTVLLLVLSACSQQVPDTLVPVAGGAFISPISPNHGTRVTIPPFYIGKYEVTQREWVAVMGTNPSQFKGGNLPVETVSWYDCVEYCNARSAKEGLTPYYTIDKTAPLNPTALDGSNWTVTGNAAANGYRLPSAAEWEYAARGGQQSRHYAFSGSPQVTEVAWYWKNAGDHALTEPWSWPELEKNHNRTHPVGGKAPNELGLYDMAGNVREWCADWHEGTGPDDLPGRIWKGGGWIGADFCCASSFRASHEANGKGPDQGLRVCRSQ